jgi:glycosyltransferase involved in cell wall biosynthesis
MKLPKISVVIPSYNKVKFISDTLDSIVNQRYPNLEVIVQDGRSIDGTLDIIKKYAGKYPRIFRWESKKDNGQVEAINKGLKKATGEIVAFINADDVYETGAFGFVANAYLKNPGAFWFAGRGIVIDDKGREIAKLATRYKNFLLSLNSRFYLLMTNYLMQPSVFLTKKAYKKDGPFTGTKDFVTEYDLWLKLARIQMPLLVNKVLSKFRMEFATKTKTLSSALLAEDGRTIKRYTKNPLILFLHNFHNIGRILMEKTV